MGYVHGAGTGMRAESNEPPRCRQIVASAPAPDSASKIQKTVPAAFFIETVLDRICVQGLSLHRLGLGGEVELLDLDRGGQRGRISLTFGTADSLGSANHLHIARRQKL